MVVQTVFMVVPTIYIVVRTTDMFSANVTIRMVKATRYFSPCITIFCVSHIITISRIFLEIFTSRIEHLKVIFAHQFYGRI